MYYPHLILLFHGIHSIVFLVMINQWQVFGNNQIIFNTDLQGQHVQYWVMKTLFVVYEPQENDTISTISKQMTK